MPSPKRTTSFIKATIGKIVLIVFVWTARQGREDRIFLADENGPPVVKAGRWDESALLALDRRILSQMEPLKRLEYRNAFQFV